MLEIEHLVRTGLRHHPRADVDRDATDLLTGRLDLAHVHACSDLDPVALEVPLDRERALDGIRRLLEGGEEPVAGGVDLAAVEALEPGADDPMVRLDHLVPSAIAELGRQLGRPDDVREQDRRQDPSALSVAPPHPGSVAHAVGSGNGNRVTGG